MFALKLKENYKILSATHDLFITVFFGKYLNIFIVCNND